MAFVIDAAALLSNSEVWDGLLRIPDNIYTPVVWINETFSCAEVHIVDAHAIGDKGQKPATAAWVT